MLPCPSPHTSPPLYFFLILLEKILQLTYNTPQPPASKSLSTIGGRTLSTVPRHEVDTSSFAFSEACQRGGDTKLNKEILKEMVKEHKEYRDNLFFTFSEGNTS
ncbi:putative beta-D-xylosidase 6 [Iris pallida]|uniref:Beta-D-xylosidase 6 n=1 Tax=Iris pallida TaxID=29817 RepID=A0AAX6FJA9_IRIPA|nr:putative beta-D-xylosidase 6 [Iris pallida]